MKWLNLFLVVLLAGCALPDESSIWGSFSPRDSSFRTGSSSSSSRDYDDNFNTSNFAEFDEEDVWTLGGSLTWYWGKKDSPASWWKDDRPSTREPSPTPGLGADRRQPTAPSLSPRAIELLERLAREGPQEPPSEPEPPGGTVVNVVVPLGPTEAERAAREHEEILRHLHDGPEGGGEPEGGFETAGLLRLYLEAGWVTQVVVGVVVLLLGVLVVLLVVLRGPALIRAWKGWRAARRDGNGAEDPK